jgi:hypothetical protein
MKKSTDWRPQVSQIDLSITENRITSLGQMMQKSKFVDGLATPDILTPGLEMTCARSIVPRIVTEYQKIRKEARKTEAMICILSEMYGKVGTNRTVTKILAARTPTWISCFVTTAILECTVLDVQHQDRGQTTSTGSERYLAVHLRPLFRLPPRSRFQCRNFRATLAR